MAVVVFKIVLQEKQVIRQKRDQNFISSEKSNYHLSTNTHTGKKQPVCT